MAEFLGTVSLGGLYNNSVIQPRPTKPWRNGVSFGSGGTGDIPNMAAGTMANYSIGNTPALDENKLMWHKIKDGAKTLLICDRNILANASWDDLNAQNLILGKTVTIDSQQYKLRVLTGGDNIRSGSDTYSGGSPTTNEWDRFVTNEGVTIGLPTPAASDLNSTADETDRLGDHNQFWNWGLMYSWAQETYTGDAVKRASRGYTSARSYVTGTSSSIYPQIGWRPVLEEVSEYLGTVSLGGLYNNSIIQPRPTKPWGSNVVFGTGGNGNTLNMVAGTVANYAIGNTPALEANKLKWHKIKDGAKTLLICDRNILASVSWNDLNAQNLIFGKTVIIDGQRYKLRVLTGGDGYRSGLDSYSGGSPLNNEWDKFITNEVITVGLPTPAASDLVAATDDTVRLLSAHNQFWNWGYIYSWTQEACDASKRSVRGHGSTNYFNSYRSTVLSSVVGWRPVLEEVVAPIITGPALNLGAKMSNFDITYSVDSVDPADVITIKEYVNGVLTKVITPANKNFAYIINIVVSNFDFGSHTVKLEVSDNKGNLTENIYTFNLAVKKYKLTLSRPVIAVKNTAITSRDFTIRESGTELALVNVKGSKLYYEGNLTAGKVDIEVKAKGNKSVKRFAYAVY